LFLVVDHKLLTDIAQMAARYLSFPKIISARNYGATQIGLVWCDPLDSVETIREGLLDPVSFPKIISARSDDAVHPRPAQQRRYQTLDCSMQWRILVQ
jgi:hypothetical protein